MTGVIFSLLQVNESLKMIFETDIFLGRKLDALKFTSASGSAVVCSKPRRFLGSLFPACWQGFYPGTPTSPHSPKTHTHTPPMGLNLSVSWYHPTTPAISPTATLRTTGNCKNKLERIQRSPRTGPKLEKPFWQIIICASQKN